MLAMDASGEAATAMLMKRMEDDRGRWSSSWPGTRTRWQRLISFNPGFASRFRDYIEFPDYTDQELCEIFRLIAGRKGICLFTGAMEQFSCGLQRSGSCHISGMLGRCGRSARRPWICMRSICRTARSLRRGSSFPQQTSRLSRTRVCSGASGYRHHIQEACGRGKNGFAHAFRIPYFHWRYDKAQGKER